MSAFFSVAEFERISVFMEGEGGGGGDVPNSQFSVTNSQGVQFLYKNSPSYSNSLNCDKQSVIYTPKKFYLFFFKETALN